MTLATLALVASFTGQAPAAPPPAPSAKVVPMTVAIQAKDKADAGAQTWVRELRSALEARKDEFRLAKPGETAELVVRVDSVGKGPNDTQVMNGALVMGKATRAFNIPYAGVVRTQAEALARNLRKFADQMKAAPASR